MVVNRSGMDFTLLFTPFPADAEVGCPSFGNERLYRKRWRAVKRLAKKRQPLAISGPMI
jgi:hypothetical protein